MLNPLSGYIVAKPDDGITQTKSGILLETPQTEIAKATVLTVGEGVDIIQPNDVVIYKPYSSTEVEHEKENYLMIDAMDVIAIVNG